MKRNATRTSVFIIVLALALWGGAAWSSQAASSETPGSIDDPVVTKSYVDKLIGGGNDEAKKELQALMEAFRTEIENAGAGNQSEVVVVKPGQTLFAEAGAQFVLRAGKGVAYSSDANGISDVTEGRDIKSGLSVPNNHLILFPRAGRGVMPDPSHNGDLTVLVLGGYSLQ